MKKGFILLSVLISLQLYGCSEREAEGKDTTTSVSEVYSQESEALSVGAEEEKEPETFDEELPDENSDLSTAQGDDLSIQNVENAESTENTESVENLESTGAAAQDTVPQSEETAASDNDSYYSAATDISRDEVESYAVRIKQQFLDHDWSAISSEISYPITIADVVFHSSEEFLDASGSFDGKLQESFFEALEKEDCVEMLCSWEGIMLGETGEIWIGEVLDEGLNSQGLKIVAINGLLTK